MKKVMYTIIVLSCCFAAGCILPFSSNMTNESRTQTDTELIKLVNKYLPEGAVLVSPASQKGVEAIQKVDLNQDGKDEVLATYKVGNNPGQVGAFLLMKNDQQWKKVWEENNFGYELDRACFMDLDADSRPEFLFASLVGVSAGNEMEILTWHNNTMIRQAASSYNKLEIVDRGQAQQKGKALALWQKDTGDAYRVELYHWDECLIPDLDLYPSYYKEVVDYYQDRVKENPDAYIYWCYLADAQVKAGFPEAALKSIQRGTTVSSYKESEQMMYRCQFMIAEGEAINQLGRYEEAIKVFDSALNVILPMSSTYMAGLSAQVYADIGDSYAGSGQYEKARAAYLKSLEVTDIIHPTDLNTQSEAGVLARRGLKHLEENMPDKQ